LETLLPLVMDKNHVDYLHIFLNTAEC